MKKSSICIIAILLCCWTALAAAERVFIDNTDIHEYKGRLGKWTMMGSSSALVQVAREFGSAPDEVYAINENPARKIGQGTYVFIPFSDSYLEKLSARGISRTPIESTDDQFIWPLEDVRNISSVLGLRGGRFHSGMDIPAQRGKPVCASMEGRVICSVYLAGFGNTIDVEHRNNFITRYSHLSANFVKKGDFVRKGQIVGLVGSTGISTGNHLHFEIRCNDIPLDPLDFLPANDGLKLLHTIKNWK
ncbi:MAG TPA: M23 family metallopeptidase [Spirochaetota bacterium]|nr:M23 family metallopeptidase [Spirochaetota bacterium]OPZ36282.1 MAG: Murein hydrolase activator NlpD precursor [Spirochaetes bacterium ADurb.BinA120]HPO47003.1 M23 family metallopeptidase [Spirochaetota bacterium]HPV96811.1 M23 family metallopeptidase [Spirochaetota bacterium]